MTVTLHRTAGQLELDLPHSLIPSEFVDTDEQQDSLAADRRVGDRARARPPAVVSARRATCCKAGRRGSWAARTTPLRKDAEMPLDSAVRLGLALDETTLPIQGPPGSGKTYTAAQMIVALVRAGKKVGVTANSHR